MSVLASDQISSAIPRGYEVTLGSANNTTDETDIISATIPADDWADNEVIIIDTLLAAKVDTVAVGAITVKLKYGATSMTLVDGGVDLDNTVRTNRFRIELWRVGTSIYIYNTDGTTANPRLSAPLGIADYFATDWTNGEGNSVQSAQTFDSAKDLKVTAQWDVADANNTFGAVAARIIKS